MITEDRLKHMLQVARTMYNYAKEKGCTEYICRDFFLCGFIHDIGYEWGNNKTHAEIGAMVLNFAEFNYKEISSAVQSHGDANSLENGYTQMDVALNLADMTTDKSGTSVTIEGRLDDIKSRYGEDSSVYKEALRVVDFLVKEGAISNT